MNEEQGVQMYEGMMVQPDVLIATLESKLAAHAMREAHLEAAVQQLMMERDAARHELETHHAVPVTIEEVAYASAERSG